MRPGLYLILLSVPLAAQTTGVVVDAVTGAPLPGAYVSVPGVPAVVTHTDAAGHFSIDDLGPRAMRAARTGYVEVDNIFPKKGQEVTIRLSPAAVIAGRLEDEDGYPVSQARVEALRYREINGERRLVPMGRESSVASNDLGDYRIGSLEAGRYYLRITPGNSLSWEHPYPIQYFGGTLAPKQENRVEVKVGELRDKTDIRLIQSEGVSVTGRIEGLDTTSRTGMLVSLRGIDFYAASLFTGSSHTDGTFAIPHVVPGQYKLIAHTGNSLGQPGSQMAEIPVEVGENGVSGLAVSLHAVQPVDVAGSVVPEAGGILAPMAIVVRGGYSNISVTVRPQPDGSFVLKGLLPGHYDIQAVLDTAGLSPPEWRKAFESANPLSMKLGDREVLWLGFEVDSKPVPPLSIKLGKLIKVSGKVVTASGQPVPDMTVYLASGQSTGSAKTDDIGTYHAILRTPGNYRVYVMPDLNMIYDSDYLKDHEADFPPVNIVAGENPPLLLRWTGK